MSILRDVKCINDIYSEKIPVPGSTTFRDLARRSNHWATGDPMVSKMKCDWKRITRLHN